MNSYMLPDLIVLLMIVLFFALAILVNFVSPIILKQKYRWLSIVIAVGTIFCFINPIYSWIISPGHDIPGNWHWLFIGLVSSPPLLVSLSLSTINAIMILKQK
ncbi:hypothetical protein COJ15_32735 [Bacillus thuringiensis]|uniref:Uncharacterized protein n=1 Tax=Bacillus thuringiensis TaxID=1428 RepID=A0A9X6WH67_BACTU|nr:hypothetical protein COJ15_32735 [Bacillus thuringiensis]